ncbi:MAG: hypothetical protein ACYTAO_03570 [Planctomycetota bacterium]|jgi:hypothetical protein
MPTEVNTQTDDAASADAQTAAAPQGNAPDLTPAQVQKDAGRAADVDIPTGADAPAAKPDAAAAGEDRGQPVPTNGKPGRSVAAQADAIVDASALFEQVKNLPAGELDTLIAAIESELTDTDDGDVDLDEPSTSTGKQARADDGDEPIGYARLDVGSQKAIGAVHSHMVEQAIGQALDSDEELAYNMKQASPKAQESVKSIVRDRLQRFVDERGDRFDYNWGHAAKQAVAAEKTRLAPFFERPARPGMGPGSQTDFQVNRELKAPERVPAFADDAAHDEYLMERMRYNQSLIEREQSNTPGA